MPDNTVTFAEFDRAEYLRLNKLAADTRAAYLEEGETEALAEISAAEWAVRKAADQLLLAQARWTARSRAKQEFAEAMAGPLVDVIDNLTGKVVGTGHLIESSPTSEWFGLDARASFRRTSYTIVPAGTRKGPKPAHVR